jgi:hypothetical protein
MSLDINSQNIAKVNSLTQRIAGLNVTDASKAGYAENVKKADADGNGRISQDEYKRYAKDVVGSAVDLSAFGDAQVILEDFDAFLGDWFKSVDGLDAAEGIGVQSAPKVPVDTGKTRVDLAAEKIARGEELNFGHHQVDGQLWKMQDGSPVWADTGTQVSREQLAAMPDYQVKKFYQMMGLGYDAKADWPDATGRERLADNVRYYPAGTPQAEAFQSRQNALIDLENIGTKLSERITQLEGQKEGADATTLRQIEAQLGQLGRTFETVSGMRKELENFKIPNKLSAEEGARLNTALKDIGRVVREVPGMDGATLTEAQVRITHMMNQARQPGIDVNQDPLSMNQYNAMLNGANLQNKLLERMDHVLRQSLQADPQTQRQIDAQLAQLNNTFGGVANFFTRISSFRPDPSLSAAERQEKAAVVDKLDKQLRQLAGMDAEQFPKMLAEMNTLFDKL